MSTLILLPHMDDEVFIIPYLIKLAKNRTDSIHFCFLTKSEGRLNRYSHTVREAESALMLSRIAPGCKIEFVGSKLQVEDLALHSSLDIVFNFLMGSIDRNCDLVISPHYEGGHIDHDSTSILAQRVCNELNATLHTFNLYSGRKIIKSMYKVGKPTESNSSLKVNVGRESFKHVLMIPSVYKSQIQTWIGIYPSLVWRLLIRGNCDINISCNFDHLSKPNKGIVFYEHRNDGAFHDWSLAMTNFLNLSTK